MSDALIVFDFDRDDQSSCWEQAKALLGIDSEDGLHGRYLAFEREDSEEDGDFPEILVRRELMRWPNASPPPTLVIFIDLESEERAELQATLTEDYQLPVHVLDANPYSP